MRGSLHVGGALLCAAAWTQTAGLLKPEAIALLAPIGPEDSPLDDYD